ncbi:hypothetical protein BDY17DRAFT_98745 [Neohortaea acidophila]|uniref:DUF2415 domain-containing protein n=1 Tax=Neohortaea acidophila TaxID=245834 RepID=A0A6A6PZM5_9PEZI|nr:uncharacterized protein BDY17DRAFT_98745 [Neohortaea acidophila]KAF2485204.1 hypothetical protein BDY17DRAFT_98745 [Neohortaea acidophila]
MAIDNLLYRETDDLAYAETSFYPFEIDISHWQLRHYISAPEPDLLYYASGHDVFCLNTATKKRKHIATLPFEARCTASGYGWLCVGGGEEMGHFAAIKLDGASPTRTSVDATTLQNNESGVRDGVRRAASVKVDRMGEDIVNSISIHRIQDEEAHLDDIVAVLTNNDKTVRMYSLPQNLETWVVDLPFPMNHSTVSPDGRTLVAVGDVNAAYFFQRAIQETPPQIPKPHNRLTSASVEWKITNVATLHASKPGSTTGYFTTAWSPNGRLVAVGSEGGYITVFDMDLMASCALENGHGAIVAVVQGSRPDRQNPFPGAVRSIVFSPDPWDLLIWAEDQDRVCIGDLRTGLKTRQIVKIDPKMEGLRSITVDDILGDEPARPLASNPTRDLDEVEADFIRRYRQAPDNPTAVSFASEYIEARRRHRVRGYEAMSASLRAQRAELEDEPHEARTTPLTARGYEAMSARLRAQRAALEDEAQDTPPGLTAREQSILESLRITRQREEARSSGGVPPASVNYTSSDMFRDGGSHRSNATTAASGTRSGGDSMTRPIYEILNSMQDSLPELARTNATSSPRPGSSHGRDSPGALPSFSQFNDGAWAGASAGQRSSSSLIRLSDGSRLPRRRTAAIPTPPDSNSPTTSTFSNSNTRAGQNGATATAASAREETEDDNPWRTIEEHMTLARGPLFESAQRAQAASPLPAATTTTTRPSATDDLQSELLAERAVARTLARRPEYWRFLNGTGAALLNNGERGDRSAPRLPALVAQHAGAADLMLRRNQMRLAHYAGRSVGVRTAGLAMSADGRTLWAACEEGIFEVRLRVKGRMFWPSVVPR